MKIKNANIQQIIESQVGEWFARERASRTRPFRPSILVSRQVGAGGVELAERLSRHLDWPYYDKEIIQEVADRVGVDPRQVEFLEETDRNLFFEFLSFFRSDPSVLHDEYVRYLKRFLQRIGEVGESIVLGRGACFVLHRGSALRIRLVGERAARARHVAQEGALSVEAAAEMVETRDRERRDFLQRYFDEDVNDAAHFDLVINTSSIRSSRALGLVLEAYEQRFPGLL